MPGDVVAGIDLRDDVLGVLLSGSEHGVGHADQGYQGCFGGPGGTVGRHAHDGGGLAVVEKLFQNAVADDVGPLGRSAFMVVAEGAVTLHEGVGVGSDQWRGDRPADLVLF